MRNLRRHVTLLALSVGLAVGTVACQPQLEVTLKGDISGKVNTKYSLAGAGDITAILKQSGAKNDVTFSTGKVEYDVTTESAFHLKLGRQNVVFTDETNQGKKDVKDGIKFTANGTPGVVGVGISYSMQPTEESMKKYLLAYPKDDQIFQQEEFRQAVQSIVGRAYLKVNPTDAESSKIEVAAVIQSELQKFYGKMIQIDGVQITQIAWSDSKVSESLARIGALKLDQAEANAKADQINAGARAREAARKAFAEVSPEQREYELKMESLKRGLPVFQPALVAPSSSPTK